MPQSVLEDLKEIINSSPKSNIDGARLLHVKNNVVYLDTKKVTESMTFFCKSQSDKTKKYELSFFYHNYKLETTCTCLHFNETTTCKHIKAAAMYIEKNDNAMDKLVELQKNQKAMPLKKEAPKQVASNLLTIKNSPSSDAFRSSINNYDDLDIHNSANKYFSVSETTKNEAEIIFVRNSSRHKLHLVRLSDSDAEISCDCKLKKPCIHQKTVLNTIKNYNLDFLKVIEDLEKHKKIGFEKLNIPPKLHSFFKINFDLNNSAKVTPINENYSNLLQLVNFKSNLEAKKEKTNKNLLTSSASNANDYIFYQLVVYQYSDIYFFKPLMGKLKKNGELSKKILEFSDVSDFTVVNDSDDNIALSKDIYKRLKKDGLIYSSYSNGSIYNGILESHYTVTSHWNRIASSNKVYFAGDKYGNDLLPIRLCPEIVSLEVELFEGNKEVILKPNFYVELNGTKLKLDFPKSSQIAADLFLYQGIYYKISSESAVLLVGLWDKKGNNIAIKEDVFESIKESLFVNILDKHHIDFKSEKYKPQINRLMLSGKKVYLKEDKDNFLIVPAFMYEQDGQLFESEMDKSKMVTLEDSDGNVLIERDIETENAIEEGLRALHPDFEEQRDLFYFYLPHEKLLEGNWFFTAFDYLKTEGFEILGLKELKKLKYSPHKASISVSAGSGIDWFDLKIDLSFGTEKVAVAQLKKALLNNQKYVTLSNGTLGMLPEEWIAKYERVIKGGKIKKDGIEFNQIQYGLIDHLYEEIGNNQSLLAFHEKRQKLLSFQNIDKKKIPHNVKATLRDYQQGGYQWLHFLDEFGWGGCLADDMGLGKTLQMLAFIQSKVNEFPNIKILVVVPASLIFNWQREAEKFCPELKLLNQTGVARDKEFEIFKQYNVILTTYALLRIDIEKLKEVAFDYVILDESQAIKNPMSQTAKAAKILNSKNRLIMTGTPIENNTFDLYSQFDFLNPGLLGSIENFRDSYATPIDRDRNEQAAESLRRLIYPFILSRKKEQVAKDLPPKTETIIYCEMSKNQRKVYNKVRDKIKEDIEGMIVKDGINKSNFAILQGMLKLRQVCNSPALLTNDENTVHDSIKIDTLMENVLPVIAENHKVLIFSFFVEMLELIKERFKKEHIQYAWITGQTSQREAQVQQFQQDENCKVFLISLKAGGVGLNLTAADYVYLIDPWWNPAVEQQAIDRAHRIGQTQSVFAYKMICKDTIEEKILQLQEKKKSVADDLVNIESGTIKKLSKDDVMALFD